MFFPNRVMPARRLAARLYAYVFLDDLVLLYPLYAVLFAETGLSTAQISSLFVIWAVTGLVVEVPSGAWADAVSRRVLLVLGPLVGAAGFALWVLVPWYPAYAAGFVLWGVRGALRSGALESLVYDELARSGSQARYAGITGRAHAAGTLAVAVSTALASPVLALGGYGAVGAASVAAGLACAGVAATLPEARPESSRRRGEQPESAGYRAYLAVLREGLAEAAARPPVRAAVLLVPAVTAVWGSLEEFTPLLAVGTGVAVTTVPLVLLLLDAGMVAGGMVAGRGTGVSRRRLALLLAVAAAVMALGAMARHPAGFLPLAVAFGVFQWATVAVDARLQHAITGRARSTVTSLASLGTELATICVVTLYGAGSLRLDHATLFVLAAVGYLVVAAAIGLTRAPARTSPTSRRSRRA